jgi:hypothetical protein
MTSDRKKTGVTFWATVVVVVGLVAYPLSVGPVEWMRSHGWLNHGAEDALHWFYSPLAWLEVDGPEWIGRTMFWYEQFWTG